MFAVFDNPQDITVAGSTTVSYTAIMADVKALRTCEVSVKGEKFKLRTELEPGAVKAFRAIGMRPPSHLLSKVTLEGVVIPQ